MKWLTLTVVAACVGLASPASADVQVSIRNGLITVIAKDATVRQIMAEWARVGQARIVNAERIPGGPVTLELVNVPETQALDVLLRSVAGYLAAPRAAYVSNLSHFDRVVIMPTSSAPRVAANPSPAPPPQQAFPQIPTDDDPDEQVLPNGNGRPVFGRFAQPLPINPTTGQPMIPTDPSVPLQSPNGPQPAPANTPTPNTPFGGGVAVPGMVAPAPQPQPGQIGVPLQPQPVVPGQVRRPGGGH